MGGHEELCPTGGLESVDDTQKAELALRRERRFGLIEYVNSPVKRFEKSARKASP